MSEQTLILTVLYEEENTDELTSTKPSQDALGTLILKSCVKRSSHVPSVSNPAYFRLEVCKHPLVKKRPYLTHTRNIPE